MKRLYKYSIVSALVLFAISCQQGGYEAELATNGEMRFNITAGTRVSNGEFEAQDKLGLYVTDYIDAETPAPLQISGNHTNNEVMVFDGTKWATERPVYWGEGKSDVYAYYPYMEIVDVDDQPFSVATDQNEAKNYEASDLLWAKASGVAKTDGAVSLQMQHSMSRLVVKIMAGEEYVGSLPKDATVHLHSTVTDALVSLANGSVVKNPYGGANSIKMRNCGVHTYAEGEAVVYEAIVVPQMLETSVPLLEINSKSVSYLLEDMFNFKPGVSYTYTAVLNTSTTAIKIDIGCTTDDWNNIGGGTGGDEGGSEGGEDDGIDLSGYTDLSAAGTANCYLVQAAGNYKFKSVKGNSDDTVGNVKSVKVLWESFGTDVAPNIGDLVTKVGYKNGYVYFSTPEVFGNGNASIAVRNSKDVILWSWHIWCSEEGWNDHVYANNAGTMMDRNLGATSATPGDIGAFGLLYQWGRKDPFLGSCSLTAKTFAASTGSWNSKSGSYTMDFVEENPTTFITSWYGGGLEDKGWHMSEFEKGLYDPCPVGYRVPDGGETGFWATALGTSSSTSAGIKQDSTNRGIHWTLADGTTAAWYPLTYYIWSYNGLLSETFGSPYFSAFPSMGRDGLVIKAGTVDPATSGDSAYSQGGCSVRCVKE